MRSTIQKSLSDAEEMLRHFSSSELTLSIMEAAANLIVGAFNEGAKILVCGNGGSMCDAMHFAEEWSGRFRNDRPPLAAIALSDPAHLTCVANDYGYDFVFSRQVEALARKGDILVILSTSGNSPSIVNAAKAAKDAGVSVIGFLGKGGGEARVLCDLVIHAPGETSDRIQELHMLALHILIEVVEAELGYGG